MGVCVFVETGSRAEGEGGLWVGEPPRAGGDSSTVSRLTPAVLFSAPGGLGAVGSATASPSPRGLRRPVPRGLRHPAPGPARASPGLRRRDLPRTPTETASAPQQQVRAPAAHQLELPAFTQPTAGGAPRMRSAASAGPALDSDWTTVTHLCTSFYLRLGLVPVDSLVWFGSSLQVLAEATSLTT